ncbi:MAG: hypothetical protein OXU96_00030, partial [Gammaproteobacteria bacterium]|nr:hypothetical protein [Gammaproteobacteria bacterium]
MTVHGLTAGRIGITPTISGGTWADLGSSGPTYALPHAGRTTRIIQFHTVNDNDPEPDQTITISVGDIRIVQTTTPPGPWTVGNPGSVTFTIRASDGYVAPVDPPVVTPGPGP